MSVKVRMGYEPVGSIIYPRTSTDDRVKPAVVQHALRINGHVSSPLVFTGIFSTEECSQILMMAARRRKRVGAMMYARPNIRKSTIAWLGIEDDSEWLYAKVWQTFAAVNRWYQFDLSGLMDEIQFSTYLLGDGIGWHLDAGGGQTSTRKLSLTVQLSDDGEYSGGDLEFCACSQLEPHRRQGTIVVFPAFLAHRVTPVIQGIRCSLVAWAHGTAFR